MKNLFTLVRKRGSKSFEVSLGPDANTRDHRALVKRLRFERGDSAYDEVIIAKGVRRHRLSKLEAPLKADRAPKPQTKQNIGQRVSALAKRFIGS